MADRECPIVSQLSCFSLGVDWMQSQLLLYCADSGRDSEATSEQFDKLLIEYVNFGAKHV